MRSDDFRAFAFSNAVRLYGGMNPGFIDGTPIVSEARSELADLRA